MIGREPCSITDDPYNDYSDYVEGEAELKTLPSFSNSLTSLISIRLHLFSLTKVNASVVLIVLTSV